MHPVPSPSTVTVRQLVVHSDIRELLPPLSRVARLHLEMNIERYGCLCPVLVWNNILLDGFERREICIAKKIPYKLQRIDFLNRKEAEQWRLEQHVGRRNLTRNMEMVLAYKIYKERAAESRRERARKGGLVRVAGFSEDHSSTEKRLIEVISEETGAPVKVLRNLREIDNYSPALMARVEAGLEYSYAHSEMTRLQREDRRAHALAHDPGNVSEDITILDGDMSQLFDRLEDNSVDLMMSDPPFSDIGLYEKYARLGAAKLRPGGYWFCFLGLQFLRDIIFAIDPYINYYWALKVDHAGVHIPIPCVQIFNSYKLVLLYRKPPITKHPHFDDSLTGTGRPDTRLHEYAQNADELVSILRPLTEAGQLLVDCFVGSGTNAIVAKTLGLRFIGTELLPERAALARLRVAEYEPADKNVRKERDEFNAAHTAMTNACQFILDTIMLGE